MRAIQYIHTYPIVHESLLPIEGPSHLKRTLSAENPRGIGNFIQVEIM